MNIDDFEEEILDRIDDIAPNAVIRTSEEGEVIIFTNLRNNGSNELEEIDFDEAEGFDEDDESLEDMKEKEEKDEYEDEE